MSGTASLLRKRALSVGLATLTGLAALASGTPAAARTDRQGPVRVRFGAPVAAVNDGSAVTSSNWAGYAVTAPGTGLAAATAFSNVYGTWIQPAATCTGGQPTYSVFWVGLGGFAATAHALEQIGTSADCGLGQKASYFAWYELVPAAPVKLRLEVRPGDAMSAAVTVAGQIVSFRIKDLTTHAVANRRLRMASPDLSSAELIAEAPSSCNRAGRCHALPLANFGTVDFTSGAATAASRSATLDDHAWSVAEIDLQQVNGLEPGQLAPGTQAAGAVPTALGSNGSFSVIWQQAPALPPTP
jgi:hypothetical protein